MLERVVGGGERVLIIFCARGGGMIGEMALKQLDNGGTIMH